MTSKNDLGLGEAAHALGGSSETLGRGDRAGKVKSTRHSPNRRRLPRAEIHRLSQRPARHVTGASLSARNRFPGVVTSIESDGVMAVVEIEAGPHPVSYTHLRAH